LASEDAKTKDLELDANKIAAEIIQTAQESENEPDLRQRVKFILRARLSLWKRFERRNARCALVGGMNEEEFRELSQRYTDYLENLITHPSMIKKTPEVHMFPR
jgi:hypothetical protein